MRYLVLLGFVALLTGCGFVERASSPEVMDAAGGAVGSFLSGDTAAAVGQSIDVVLILLGLKVLKKGGQVAGKAVKTKLAAPPTA